MTSASYRLSLGVLWASHFSAVAAGQFYLVTLAWIAFQLTGSSLALGTILFAGMLPRSLFSLLAGSLTDQLSPQSLLWAVNALRTGIVVASGVAITIYGLESRDLYILAIAMGTASAFYVPAYYSAVPVLAEQSKLHRVNSILRSTEEIARVAAPPLAGGMLAVAEVPAALLITGTLFGFSTVTALLLYFRMRALRTFAPQGSDDKQSSGVWNSLVWSLRNGLIYINQVQGLRAGLLLVSIANLTLYGTVSVGFVWLSDVQLERTAITYGFLVSAWSLGLLAGSASVGLSKRQWDWKKLLAATACLQAASLGLIPFFVSPAGVAILACVMGSGAGAFNVLFITWIQQATDQQLHGRVFGLIQVLEWAVAPTSYLIVGVILDFKGGIVFPLFGALLGIGAVVFILSTVRTNFTIFGYNP